LPQTFESNGNTYVISQGMQQADAAENLTVSGFGSSGRSQTTRKRPFTWWQGKARFKATIDV